MPPQKSGIFVSVEEYLYGEQGGQVRHEYVDGKVYAVVGASDRHALIAGDLLTFLNTRLSKPWRNTCSSPRAVGRESVAHPADSMRRYSRRDSPALRRLVVVVQGGADVDLGLGVALTGIAFGLHFRAAPVPAVGLGQVAQIEHAVFCSRVDMPQVEGAAGRRGGLADALE